MGWPAAGGSPLAAEPPLLTPHGWNFGLPLPAVPGERHGFHFPQSPKRESLSMLYVRTDWKRPSSDQLLLWLRFEL